MQPNERNKFARLMTDVLAYYNKEASTFVLEIWWSACCGFEYEQIFLALKRHIVDPDHGQFAPKVADLARILQGTTTERASIAWGKVHETMNSVGAYSDVVFDDAAIHAAIDDLGGWPKLCRTDLRELGHLQHRFMQSYHAYTARRQFDYPKRLCGDRSPDHEYERIGMQPPKPAIVGNWNMARMVYRNGGTGKINIAYQSIQSLAAPIAAAVTFGEESAA